MKLYLLYYESMFESGSREAWSVFYTPCEVFDSEEKREARIEFIKKQVDEDGEPIGYEFEKVDTVLMTDVTAKLEGDE